MDALFSDEERMIAEAAQGMTRGGRARARSVLEGAVMPEEPTKSLMLHWLGLGIPESLGGSGGSLVGAAVLLQELGYSLEPTPFTCEFIARHVMAAAGLPMTDFAKRQLAVDFGEGLCVEATRVTGTLAAVPGATKASAILARDSIGGLVLVEALSAAVVKGVDILRPCARVYVDAEPLARVATSERATLLGSTLVAAELCGVARGALALATDHAKSRAQFGRPIGSYQAIAHRLAQAAADIETAWSLVLYSCWAIQAAAVDFEEAAHAAKANAGEAALSAVEACIQTHGGMGITYAADPHLYLRRALFNDAWFGAAYLHRRSLGRLALARCVKSKVSQQEYE